MFFEKERKMQSVSFSRCEVNQNVMFRIQTLFQNMTRQNLLNQNLTPHKKF